MAAKFTSRLFNFAVGRNFQKRLNFFYHLYKIHGVIDDKISARVGSFEKQNIRRPSQNASIFEHSYEQGIRSYLLRQYAVISNSFSKTPSKQIFCRFAFGAVIFNLRKQY